MMSQPNQNKYTKIFVGGLAWKTTTDDLKTYFQKLGEVLDANAVLESYPGGRSKGYGFVVFRDAETAAKFCEPPYPVIDGRQTNINMAYLGAKNNITHKSNQNGSSHEARAISHHNHNGSLNQAALYHQYQPNPQCQPYFTPVYWDPYAGQYRYMYNGPYYHHSNPMQMFPYVPTNWHQANFRPAVISAPPRRSSVKIENIDETDQEVVAADVAHNDDNEKLVPEPCSDVDQQYSEDQEEEIMSEQDYYIEHDADDQEVEIMSEQDNGIKKDVRDQEVEIMSEQDNGIKKDVKDQEVEIKSGKGIKQDANVSVQVEFGIEDTYQKQRFLGGEVEDSQQESKIDLEEEYMK